MFMKRSPAVVAVGFARAGRVAAEAGERTETANSWLTSVGIVLTAVYAAAVILRPRHRILRLGGDSIIVVFALAIGVLGLTAVSHQVV